MIIYLAYAYAMILYLMFRIDCKQNKWSV